MSENENINLPTNIKQIGSIDAGRKIYMEDYVHTYIQQFSSITFNDERIAVLIGKNIEINGEKILFISGAIQGKFTVMEKNITILTEKSWQYINKQIKTFFDGLKVVGWIYIQPGYGDCLNENLSNYHLNNFKESYQVLFINDPMEKTSSFFAYNENKNQLEQLKGYIIYYERNDGMHEYMLESKTTKLKNEKNEDAGNSDSKIIQKSVKSRPRTSHIKTKSAIEQKKIINLFGSLSFVLFLVCFIMGAGLIQNDDRISKIEQQLDNIDNSYKYLLTVVKQDNSQNVFAAQDIQNQTTTKEEQEAKTEITTQNNVKTTTEITTQNNIQVTTEKEIQNTTIDYSQLQDYKIKQGDTLSSICRKFYDGDSSRVKEILEINGFEDPDQIHFGDVIKLPKK